MIRSSEAEASRRERLLRLESEVDRVATAEYVVRGRSYGEIVKEKLYLCTHENMESYFRDRWDEAVRMVYRFIRAAELCDFLLDNGVSCLPARLAQCTKLLHFPEPERVEAWNSASSGSRNSQETGRRLNELAVRRGHLERSTGGNYRRVRRDDLCVSRQVDSTPEDLELIEISSRKVGLMLSHCRFDAAREAISQLEAVITDRRMHRVNEKSGI